MHGSGFIQTKTMIDTRGTLYIVATPIGNAGDISERARRALADAGLIAAEDTRTANTLLKTLGIKNKTVSNHKFNENYRVEHIIGELERGVDVAVVSDAGTPCISDPGAIIVRAAVERGIRVKGVGGTSAITTALSVSGFSFDAFTFYGFMPRGRREIESAAAGLMNARHAAAVFFESPKRIKKTLGVFAEVIPCAALCLCNDLTKTYERIYRGAPQAVLDELLANPFAEKGEYTLVCMAGGEQAAAGSQSTDEAQAVDAELTVNGARAPSDDINAAGMRVVGRGSGRGGGEKNVPLRLSPEAALIEYMTVRGVSMKEAISTLSNKAGYTRKGLYAASLNLKKMINHIDD